MESPVLSKQLLLIQKMTAATAETMYIAARDKVNTPELCVPLKKHNLYSLCFDADKRIKYYQMTRLNIV